MTSRRDALGWSCFLIHIAVLVGVVLGWAVPGQGWLVFYLAALPLMVLHWKLNDDACILNNLENCLRHRRWRALEINPEEGAWLRTLLADTTGIRLTQARMDGVIYGAMALFWLLGLLHWMGKF